MQHSIEWQDEAVNAAPEERATLADLRLFLNSQNVTSYISNGMLDDHVTVALYGITNELVHRWWTIFGSRDRGFCLKNYRMGYLLPDIRLQFDGTVFEASSHQCDYTNPDLRFFGDTTEVLSRAEGEAWLSDFIEEVLARLESKGKQDTSAAIRWQRVQSSRNSEESVFCEAAGSLGLDPYQIDDKIADFIEKSENIFKAEALIEFIAGSRGVDQDRLFQWVNSIDSSDDHNFRLSELRPIVDEIEAGHPVSTATRAWALGYRRARNMRQALNLPQNHRFPSLKALATRLGAPEDYTLAPKVDGINALRVEKPDGIHMHVRNVGQNGDAAASHLFTLARAIGDAACFPAPETSPINGLSHAYRQAAGRAFAAEFLAPIDEVQTMLEDEMDADSIADAFGVSHHVIARQVENRERIQLACNG